MIMHEKKGKEPFFVLIETYWNVNVGATGSSADVGGVLIETYWNVNAT